MRLYLAESLAVSAMRRVALVMADQQDANLICKDSIVDGIRETLQMSLTTAKGGHRKGLWICPNQFQDPFRLLEEFISQSSFAFIIPAARFIDFSSQGFVVREFHTVRRFAKCAMNSPWLISMEGSRSSSASRWLRRLSSSFPSSPCGGSPTDSHRQAATRHRSPGLSCKAASMMDS